MLKQYLGQNFVLTSFIAILCAVAGCTQERISTSEAVAVGAGLLKAAVLDESDIKRVSAEAAEKIDSDHQIAAPESTYDKRLRRLTDSVSNRSQYNFKVYMNDKLNAFAMADGTIRVYSGLMDVMSDAELLAVIQHEIGHVELRHVYEQTKEMLYTNAAFQAAVAAGGTIGELTQSQLGQLAYQAVNAHFSQKDELEADAYAVKALAGMNRDPVAMKQAIKVLKEQTGGGGGFISSHPSNEARMKHIEKQIARLTRA